ncbi:MAG: hypothetical protein CMH65_04700 [Nevskiales bacterium]|nr:hypothetical protein [Nevskiales bacterium]
MGWMTGNNLMMTTRLLAPALAALSLLAATASASPDRGVRLAQLQAQAGDALTVVHRPHQQFALLRAASDQPLIALDASAPPLERALQALGQFGETLGVRRADQAFVLNRVSHDAAGGTHVHLDQVHRGVPVFAARVVVHLDDRGARGISGVVIEGLEALNTAPYKSAAQAESRALAMARKHHLGANPVIESTRLVYYRHGLLRGIPGSNHLAYEVNVVDAYRRAEDPVREQIIVDANSGVVLNRIDRIHRTLNREIYTPTLDVPPVVTEGSALAPADPEFAGDVTGSSRIPATPTDNLYIFAGGTYALYDNMFGYAGYDHGAVAPEEQVQRSVYLINQNCPNAYWDGVSTNYCPGFDADDIVSHEWSHGYTEYTHGLIYQYQSGALNESYSDIYGEMYDLINGLEGPLGATLTEGEYFENGGSRWVLGEDLSEAAAGLLLRDMWDPDNFGANVPILGIPVLSTPSPGSVITSENYYCATGDNGGVHTNSGVPNHAFAMLVDGKSFNGVDIPAIGMIKAAHIYFHAATHYQTPSTTFPQHADALEQSCADLTGVPLNDYFGEVSGDIITAADCDAVAAAMLAVEMREDPTEKCGYLPVLSPEAETPAICGEDEVASVSFSEDFESGSLPADWVLTSVGATADWPDTHWEISGDVPGDRSAYAAFALDSLEGSCAPGGDISGQFSMDTPAITVNDTDTHFEFTHFVQTETSWDGGNLMVSVNGSAFSVVDAAAFLHNPHGAPLNDATVDGNTNPKAGEAAWHGSDQGFATGSWGTTILDLTQLASAGDTVQFRWDFGQDGCNGNLGWFVDDVKVLGCVADVGNGSGGGDGGSGGGSGSGSSPDSVSGGGSLTGGASLALLLMAGARLRRRRRHMN